MKYDTKINAQVTSHGIRIVDSLNEQNGVAINFSVQLAKQLNKIQAILASEEIEEQKKERRISKLGGIEQYEINEIRSTAKELRESLLSSRLSMINTDKQQNILFMDRR